MKKFEHYEEHLNTMKSFECYEEGWTLRRGLNTMKKIEHHEGNLTGKKIRFSNTEPGQGKQKTWILPDQDKKKNSDFRTRSLAKVNKNSDFRT